MLQQYLPFTVLKLVYRAIILLVLFRLQQYLPFTVLKLIESTPANISSQLIVATVPTVYGIETNSAEHKAGFVDRISCNSTYRLRY